MNDDSEPNYPKVSEQDPKNSKPHAEKAGFREWTPALNVKNKADEEQDGAEDRNQMKKTSPDNVRWFQHDVARVLEVEEEAD